MRGLTVVLLSLLTLGLARDAPARFGAVPAEAQGRVTVRGSDTFYTVRDGATWRIELAQSGVVVVVHANPSSVVLSPALSPAGERLYFESSARHPGIPGREDTDVWVMDRVDGRWSNVRPLGPPFDSPYNEHAPTVDGGGTICFNSGRPDGLGENDIYCGRADSVPQLIRAISSPEQDAGPWLAGGGEVLLFTSNRPGGQGGWDLYASTRSAAGWNAPQNLGARINTAADELWPTWTDGQLYFKRTGGTEPPGYFSVPLPLPR